MVLTCANVWQEEDMSILFWSLLTRYWVSFDTGWMGCGMGGLQKLYVFG